MSASAPCKRLWGTAWRCCHHSRGSMGCSNTFNQKPQTAPGALKKQEKDKFKPCFLKSEQCCRGYRVVAADAKVQSLKGFDAILISLSTNELSASSGVSPPAALMELFHRYSQQQMSLGPFQRPCCQPASPQDAPGKPPKCSMGHIRSATHLSHPEASPEAEPPPGLSWVTRPELC